MKDRIVYFDYLRVFAIFAVIMIHVSAQHWYITNVNSYEWQIFNVYNSVVRWAVPVFVMISGALLLDREYDFKKIYSKNILRMVVAFFFWSVIYALVFWKEQYNVGFIKQVFTGHFHMWFIPMIIGLYICLPIIHKIIESEKIMKYFLFLAFLFAFFFPQILQLVNDFGGEKINLLFEGFNTILENMNLQLVLGYTGYFVLGHYLNNLEMKKSHRLIIYLLGILSGIVTILLVRQVSINNQAPIGHYYENFNINILLESFAVFVFFKYNTPKIKNLGAIMNKLAKYSFGAYLIHVLILDQLNVLFGLNTLSFHPIVSVPVIGIIVFIVSFILSAIINQIPFLKKYIV